MARYRLDKRDPTGRTYIVKWEYPGSGEWSRSVKAIGNRSAKQVAAEATRRLTRRIRLVKEGELPILSHVNDKASLGSFLYGESTAMLPQPVEVDAGAITDLVTEYLETRYLMVLLRENKGVRRGGLSRGSYSSDYYRLQNFLRHCKNCSKTQVSSIVTADFLRDYRNKLHKAVAGNRQSPEDAKHHLRTVKALLMWALNEEFVDYLPRNLLSKDFAKLDIKPPDPQHFSLEQIRSLFAAANPRMRLYILLGLNCGYTQSDIASLTHAMVDLDNGYIRRDRQKTGVQSEHKLWPVTQDLLKQFATKQDTGGPLLLNSHGRVLYEETRKDDGRVTKKDTIGGAFAKLRKSLTIPFSFKHLRKTGANLIEKQYQEHPHLAKLFLSHETQGVQKHYTGRSYGLLHTATDWLCGYFDLSDGGTLEGSGGANSE
jgi:integrase